MLYAVKLVKKLQYTGPVLIGTDDTSIEKALQAYRARDGSWLVIGGCGKPMVARPPSSSNNTAESNENDCPTNILDLLKNQSIVRADKVRVIILTIPIPKVSHLQFEVRLGDICLTSVFKVPPIILAAIARGGGNEDAGQLKRWHDKVINILAECNCFPISGAVDGTETEHKLQRLIDSSPSVIEHHIAPSIDRLHFTLRIPLINNHPFVNVQDSKHGAKTARNQMLSGARLLTLGRHVILYDQLASIAHEPGGPLMVRDVEKLDRQDDRAAARLLSSAMISHLAHQHPEWIGLGAYLFVMGGLFEAWQNRTIGHEDRLQLVLRARYFLVFWREHIIRHPLHGLSTNFISRESFEIMMILCDSFIKLYRLHRDVYPDYPFVPWLHSTEPNEHLYGVARTVKTDFTYLNFVQLVPKISTLLLGAFGSRVADAKSNTTASGYLHTYATHNKANLAALRTYQGDEVTDEIALIASTEASQLLTACGVYGLDFPSMLPQTPLPQSAGVHNPDLDCLVGEDVHAELFKPSALLCLFDELEGKEKFSNVLPTLTKEDRLNFCKFSYSQVGTTLAYEKEM